MIEFVVTPEMQADAKSDRMLMRLLADEVERAGIVFESREPYKLAEPFEIIKYRDGTLVYRQHLRQ